MSTEYTVNEEMLNAVVDLISDAKYSEFQPIREANLSFMVASMEKTNKDDEHEPTSGDPVIVRKVGPADAVFMEGQFKVYIDAFRWSEATAKNKKAMLHAALMRIDVTASEEGVVLGTRKPDVVAFNETIERFGAWNDPLVQMRENLDAAREKLRKNAERQEVTA